MQSNTTCGCKVRVRTLGLAEARRDTGTGRADDTTGAAREGTEVAVSGTGATRA